MTSTRYDQTNTNIVKTGVWSNFTSPGAYLGSYGRSSTAGATATIYFTGTRIDWIGMKGTTPGIVDVYLDDVKKATLDLYAASAKYQVDLVVQRRAAQHESSPGSRPRRRQQDYGVHRSRRGRHLGDHHRQAIER